MKKNSFSWLALEPFVHCIVKDNDVLLYNTVNKQLLMYSQNSVISEIAGQLSEPSNGYVSPITDEQLQLPAVQSFIKDLRKKYMGDLLDPEWSDSKPFNMVPDPVIKKGGQKLKHRLSELTIHLNSWNDQKLKLFKNASKQFIFPLFSEEPSPELSYDILKTIAGQISSLPFATINFTGSYLSDPVAVDHLRSIFAGPSFRRKFHILLYQLDPERYHTLNRQERLSLYIISPVSSPESDALRQIVHLDGKQQRVEYNFIVEKSEDLDFSLELIRQYSIKKFFFKPYFNGGNMKFFEDHVFITEEDLKASKPTQSQIFSRITMNENDRGKLVIVPDGSVFANINDQPLGNILTASLDALIEKELLSGTSWNRRRNAIDPCRHCIYQFLCPPVSNYEIYMNRFNFCHIYS